MMKVQAVVIVNVGANTDAEKAIDKSEKRANLLKNKF